MLLLNSTAAIRSVSILMGRDELAPGCTSALGNEALGPASQWPCVEQGMQVVCITMQAGAAAVLRVPAVLYSTVLLAFRAPRAGGDNVNFLVTPAEPTTVP